jgi:uncharacterized protein YggE
MNKQLGVFGLALSWCFAVWTTMPITSVASAQMVANVGSDGITVFGTGELRAKPNVVQIDLRASAKAELTDDAIVKFKDSKKRTLEAFEALKMQNLKIDEQGLALAPGNSAEIAQMMWNGIPAQNTKKPQIEIGSTLHLELAGVRDVPPEELLKTIGKLLDVAQDSGASIGPSQAEAQMAYRYGRMPTGTMVKFVLRDLSEMREKVYEKAVTDARNRAQRLAKLNAIKLGPVISVQEVQVSGDESNYVQQQPWETGSPMASSRDEPEISSSVFSEITFRVKLMVRFGIDKVEPAAAKAETGVADKAESKTAQR